MRLQPLDCPSCGAALAADQGDVVYYCTACRNGYRLVDPAAEAPTPADGSREPKPRLLVPVDVRFVAMPSVAVSRHLPFWLLPARVTIHERRATGGSVSGLLRAFLGASEAAATSGAAYFLVPAFRAPLATVVELATRYTTAFPKLGELLAERLVGGDLSPEDAKKLAHHALVAAEISKPDTLQALRYDLVFGEPCLLGVPFVTRGGDLADALFGVTTPAP